MVKVTFNSSLAKTEPKKPDQVGTEQTLLPADKDVEDGQQVRRQRPTPWCWYLWVAFIIVAIATVLVGFFFFAFGQKQNWWSYRSENDNVHEFWERDQETYSDEIRTEHLDSYGKQEPDQETYSDGNRTEHLDLYGKGEPDQETYSDGNRTELLDSYGKGEPDQETYSDGNKTEHLDSNGKEEPDQETYSDEDYDPYWEPELEPYSYEDYMESPQPSWIRCFFHRDSDETDEAEMSTEVPPPQLEERVQVLEEDKVELIQVPEFKFSGTVPANIVHDFSKNLTAFLDLTQNKCYVAPLNTSAVLPPRDLQELITNIMAGTYLPQFHLIHEQLVVTGRLDDVEKLGSFISNMCRNYETYRLEHRTATTGIQKREALNCRKIRHFENMYVTETQICEL